jgi:hypothetical protein
VEGRSVNPVLTKLDRLEASARTILANQARISDQLERLSVLAGDHTAASAMVDRLIASIGDGVGVDPFAADCGDD